MAGDIVVGYEGSEGGRAALRAAVPVAKAFDAPLVIVFGYEVNPLGGETADYRKRVEELGTNWLAEALTLVNDLDAGVHAETLMVPERAVDALVNVARSRQARVIVVGGSGTGPLLGAVLGSVAHKLLYRSPLPVLVVPVAS